ncbi:hypothetical protein QFZ22_000195 [Streptomyces canus]|uniref:Uncharacterized protein n=1 Tax=Streptomyces canus TaxID=58343 RepID=A0AAW8F4P9_9ACTN|nr:hypothetical protein [Streptomyces canus]MDQ0904210.1 hypothetical protein [Streptomyces canus]
MSEDRQARSAGDGALAQARADLTTQQQRRVDWMMIATVVAAFAAAGGLIFSGWTSYYSVETARDQLAQSREEADRELRQQAVLVSAWTQQGEKEQTTGFITNRSLDPVHQVIVALSTKLEGDPRTFPIDYKESMVLVDVGSLPPCSRVTIPAVLAKHQLGPGFALDVNYTIPGVSFVDVYGKRWARPSSGPLQPLKEALPSSKEGASAISKALLGKKNWSGGMANQPSGASYSEVPAAEPLKDCGTDK